MAAVDGLADQFKVLGYTGLGEYGIKGRRFFYRGEKVHSHHLHLYACGDAEVARHVQFVAFLNSHAEQAKAYERLKLTLAQRYCNAPDLYCEGKGAFIREIERLALS